MDDAPVDDDEEPIGEEPVTDTDDDAPHVDLDM